MFPDPFHDKFNQVRERVTRAHNVCSSRSKFPFQSQKYVFYLVCSLGMDPTTQCSKIGFEPALNLASVRRDSGREVLTATRQQKNNFQKDLLFPGNPSGGRSFQFPPKWKTLFSSCSTPQKSEYVLYILKGDFQGNSESASDNISKKFAKSYYLQIQLTNEMMQHCNSDNKTATKQTISLNIKTYPKINLKRQQQF